MNIQSPSKYLEIWNSVLNSDFFQKIFKPIISPVIIFLAVILLIINFQNLLFLILENFITFVGTLMLIVAFFVIWLVPAWQIKNLKEIKRDKKHSAFELEKERIKLRDDTRKTLAQVIAGAFFVFSLFVAYNTFQLNRENQFATKYLEAIKLIGSENSSQRVGGLLVLEDISKNSYKDYSSTIEFLSIHLREKSKEIKKLEKFDSKTNNNTNTNFNSTTNLPNAATVHNENSNSEQVINITSKVAALRTEMLITIGIIKRRNMLNEQKDFILQLEGSELVKADLKNADFSKAIFQSANLSEADFSRTNLSETDFNNAILHKTIFDKHTIFSKTKMKNADLSGSTISIEQLLNVIIDEKTKLPEKYINLQEELLINSKKLVEPGERLPIQTNWKQLLKDFLEK